MLDVRQQGEYDDGHVAGSINIPLHELASGIDEVPDGEVWVHCGIGLPCLHRRVHARPADRTVVLIDDMFGNAGKLGLTA